MKMMKITDYNWCNIFFGTSGFLIYLIYTIFGFILILNDIQYNQLWFYNLLSLLVVPILITMQLCFYFWFRNFKYLSCFIMPIVIWGGTIIFNINNYK